MTLYYPIPWRHPKAIEALDRQERERRIRAGLPPDDADHHEQADAAPRWPRNVGLTLLGVWLLLLVISFVGEQIRGIGPWQISIVWHVILAAIGFGIVRRFGFLPDGR